MERARPRITLEHGILRIDEKPRFLLNSDYPYFRDVVENWRPRLEAQKACGLDILTCYVPWRHHAPVDPIHRGGTYDFTGETQPNRNLIGLLDIAEELDLMVILKPGPFVHAELPYGGLPPYVCADTNPTNGIAPEIDAFGEPIRWRIGRMLPKDAKVLPAPFDLAYNVYVRSWFQALAHEVAASRFWPHGPIIAFQLLNEGIYSDSSKADPTQFAFAPSTLIRYREFLRGRYHTLRRYNDLHGTAALEWDEIEPPRMPRLLRDRCDLLAYLDWSAFQGRIYADVADLYKGYLVKGGVPEDAPIIFNFNPNGNTYKSQPASNDGWYTRVNLVGHKGFTFGSTNWLGVVAGDPRAFRQYVMANTAFRGPAMEMNWGFATEYYTPYEYVAPSVFEAMVALACGATGITAYTFAGTRAWRHDPNLAVHWIPARTNSRNDLSYSDYPGDSPIRSTGEKSGKYWSLQQMAQYLRDEGPKFIEAGPRSPLVWGIYPPYAWAGQWLIRGDADDVIWRPPLRAVPRAAYHGLDAFTEMALGKGQGVRQLDISRGDADLAGAPLLVVSAHEYMDLETQSRLVEYVENGGSLFLTNVVPDRDETMRLVAGPLMQLFPHGEQHLKTIEVPTPVEIDGEPTGLVIEVAHVVSMPADADLPLKLDGDLVGYRRRHGRGCAIFLGASPWRAALSGDDSHVACEGQALAWRLLLELGNHILPRADRGGREVMAVRHGEASLFVIVGDTRGEIAARFNEVEVTIRSPSLAVHAFAMEDGVIRACYLKGITDTRSERFAPRLVTPTCVVEAMDPCDLCFTQAGEMAHVSVAQLGRASTTVRLPLDAASVLSAVDGNGRGLRFEPTLGGILLEIEGIESAGTAQLRLRPQAAPTRKASVAPEVGPRGR